MLACWAFALGARDRTIERREPDTRISDERGVWVRAVCGGGGAAAWARAILRPLGWAYGRGMAARNLLYDTGARKARAAAIPVVSVGNITLGGTGKTPVVQWIAGRLAEAGKRPAVLSRGYGGSGGANDESRMLGEASPALLQVLDPNRARGAATAARRGADCVVLDDGFQHRRLRRDLDIVLVDALNPFGGGRVFPSGELREPLAGLGRADALVVTRGDLVSPERWERILGESRGLAPRAVVAVAAFVPVGLKGVGGRASREPGWLRGRRVFAFCGIGNPRGFVETLRSLGPARLDAVFLKDHAHYSDALVQSLAERAESVGAEAILLTQKDAVKIAEWPGDLPALALEIKLDILRGRRQLEERLLAAVG